MSYTTLLRPTSGSRLLDRSANTQIGSTTANVSRHCSINIGIIGIRRGTDQGRCGHDLTRLAIAALYDLQIEPGFLHFRAGRRRTDAFDGGDGAIAYRADRQHARAHRFAVDVHGACAALRDAATKLRSGQTEDVTKHPEQRHVGWSIKRFLFTVDRQFCHGMIRYVRRSPQVARAGANFISLSDASATIRLTKSPAFGISWTNPIVSPTVTLAVSKSSNV